jgi:hypothetical protein
MSLCLNISLGTMATVSLKVVSRKRRRRCNLKSYDRFTMFRTSNTELIDWFLVLNATFSNISSISWRPALVVEEAGNHRWTAEVNYIIRNIRMEISVSYIWILFKQLHIINSVVLRLLPPLKLVANYIYSFLITHLRWIQFHFNAKTTLCSGQVILNWLIDFR